jgi:hypothetical protein
MSAAEGRAEAWRSGALCRAGAAFDESAATFGVDWRSEM